jgi:hypothetical protein
MQGDACQPCSASSSQRNARITGACMLGLLVMLLAGWVRTRIGLTPGAVTLPLQSCTALRCEHRISLCPWRRGFSWDALLRLRDRMTGAEARACRFIGDRWRTRCSSNPRV